MLKTTSSEIFQNKWTLKLKDEKAEIKFNQNINHMGKKLNIYFSILLFIASLADIILQNCIYDEAIKVNYKYANTLLYTAYVITPISLIILFLILFIKNDKFQLFLSALNYIFIFFPMTNIRNILINTNYIGFQLFLILSTFEILIRVVIIISILLPFAYGFYINIVLLLIAIAYNILINDPYFIFIYILTIITYVIIIYFYTANIKEKINYLTKIENQNKWYSNLFEHFRSGFISFTFSKDSNKINLVNETFLEIFKINQDLKQLIKNTKKEERLKYYTTTVESYSLNDDLNLEDLKQNSEKVLQIVFKDIMPDYKNQNLNINYVNFIFDFDLTKFCNEFVTIYKNENMDEKFLLIGYKIIPYKKFINDDSESENLIYEVFLRCRDNPELGKIEFELIANDISNIKIIEEKKAELKYKSMYLSKIAHDLKNPIISIQELVKSFYDNYYKEFAFTTKIKIKESFKYLKQICSFTDYLLILIRDLDFFSRLHLDEDIPYAEAKVDISELSDYVKEIAEVLLIKYNKQTNVQFYEENNLTKNVMFNSDEYKIKQILINLISNSIKSTNRGEVKLKIDLIQNNENNENNFIKIEISDTGVGMSEEQIQNILKHFKMSSCIETQYGSGLGLFIICQLLKKLNSELITESILGQGTKMSFILPCTLVVLSPNENKKTIEREQQLNLTYERNFLPSNLGDEGSEINIINRRNINLQESEINENRSRSIHPLDFLQQELEDQLEIYQPDPNCDYFIFVDDEKLTLRSSIRVLQKAAEQNSKKIKVFEAEDGIECIFLLYKLIKKGFKVSAIVSDEMMNHMNGTTAAEVLKRVKNLNTNNIPFFLLTAYSEVENKFIDFKLTKPLNIRDAEMILNCNETAYKNLIK